MLPHIITEDVLDKLAVSFQFYTPGLPALVWITSWKRYSVFYKLIVQNMVIFILRKLINGSDETAFRVSNLHIGHAGLGSPTNRPQTPQVAAWQVSTILPGTSTLVACTVRTYSASLSLRALSSTPALFGVQRARHCRGPGVARLMSSRDNYRITRDRSYTVVL